MELKDKIRQAIDGKRIQEAVELIGSCGAALNRDPDLCHFRAVLLLMQDNVEGACRLLEAGLSRYPENAVLLADLASAYHRSKEPRKALEHYVKADIFATDPHLRSQAAKAAETLASQAGPQFQVHPVYVKAYIGAMQDLFRKGAYEQLLHLCREAMARYEGVGYFHLFAGVGFNHMGAFDEALAHHRKALALDAQLADLSYKRCVAKARYDERQRDCIGCGHAVHRVVWIGNQSVAESGFGEINPIRQWVQCAGCGLVYANPQPSDAALGRYYSLAAAEKYSGIYGNIDDQFDQLVNMYNHILFKIECHHRLEKRVLDIGTGIGIFVGVALDRGWDATGIELTPEDCAYAQQRYGLTLLRKNFYDIDEEETYAAVTLFEVIEHLPHPLADLERIGRLVADGGLLVVATPVQDSLYGKRTGRASVFWNTVGHLTYFPKQTLVDYLHRSGFEILEINLSPRGQGRMEFYCRKAGGPVARRSP